jgi:hypothetical protein
MKRYATCPFGETAIREERRRTDLRGVNLTDPPNEEPGGAAGGWTLRWRIMVTQSENARALMLVDEDCRRAQGLELKVGGRAGIIARDRCVVTSDNVRSPRAPPRAAFS